MVVHKTVLTFVLATVFMLFFSFSALAQLQIIEHGPFSEMLDKVAEKNRDPFLELSGYRIQILSTTDRLKLEEAERKFANKFAYPSNWVHEPPFYKLRTGAFEKRSDATTFMYKVKRSFPSAYIVNVKNIKPTELLRYR